MPWLYKCIVGSGLEKVWASGDLNGNFIINLENYGYMLMAPVEEAVLQKNTRRRVSKIEIKIER